MTITITEGFRIHHATLAKAMRLDTMLNAEYPALALAPIYDQEPPRVSGWEVLGAIFEGKGATRLVYRGDTVPSLGDLLDACEAIDDVDPEWGAEEDEGGRPVVPSEYRQRYMEMSESGQSCGDWLANWLEDKTHQIEGGFDVDCFTEILVANGVPMDGKWADLPNSGQNGWKGRYRMNGRQKLGKAVAAAGKIVDQHGNTEDVPRAALQELRSRHPQKVEKVKAPTKAD